MKYKHHIDIIENGTFSDYLYNGMVIDNGHEAPFKSAIYILDGKERWIHEYIDEAHRRKAVVAVMPITEDVAMKVPMSYPPHSRVFSTVTGEEGGDE